jgi:hypothetical protein
MFMSPALSIKFPPLIWNPEAESKRGKEGRGERGEIAGCAVPS